MLRILTDLWNSTVRHGNYDNTGRVYLVDEDGTTAHGVVGGNSKQQVESLVAEELERGQRIIKIEDADENSINHPLRGE